MRIEIPSFSLVVLVGASGSGKSTFAQRHFLPTEIVSSDACRAAVSDDAMDMSATDDAFALLHFLVGKRLERMKLTVVDATNVQVESRREFLNLARRYHARPTAFLFDVPEDVCHQRNESRGERGVPRHAVRNHCRDLRRSRGSLFKEFPSVVRIPDGEEVELVRTRLWTDRRDDKGPFDIIGDVHGCYDELVELLEKLGYRDGTPPDGRRAMFLGDLVDRGPGSPEVLRLAMDMVRRGHALCVPGNHDVKLLKKLQGKNVKVAHGLAETLEQLERQPEEFRTGVTDFLKSLVSHYVLDGGRLIVAHAGMKREMAGRPSAAVRDFALYGETTGETDEFGLPVRYNWALEYRGEALVVYGHTPVVEPEWLNRTINIDTGCVFGGALTALRYPERELVSVPARRTYSEPIRPLVPEVARAAEDELLDLADYVGKHFVSTRLAGRVGIREENSAAALEVMSRFAVDPRWLIYLPPTMAPCRTSTLADLLEHPEQAFEEFALGGVERVVCQEKHMGSRAVLVLCRDQESARRRFGVSEGSGCLYTRTGRRFFQDPGLEEALLQQVRRGAEGLWEELATDWVLLDCELMPWSAKAGDLVRTQYASVGSAAMAALAETVALMDGVPELKRRFQHRLEMVERYTAAYQAYCWPVDSADDLRLAPFHLLASEGAVHADRDHLWHMSMLARMGLHPTAHRVVDLTDPASRADAVSWWESLTASGGEGMVVKPLQFTLRTGKGLVQPAVKCRGREYLRIIYGPEYTDQLDLLRRRGLSAKRSLALREFGLGIEGLERFVRRDPLRLVHQCVFAVLALESEPVDPRL
ncbi:MAG: polynucleotide kinase-phosphatase [Candidatus Eremiobacterota bacterium]